MRFDTPRVDPLDFPAAVVINLDRRGDRLRRFSQACPIEFDRVAAADGKRLHGVHEGISRIGLRDGEYGCFVSHVRIWRNMIATRTSALLIFEDDAIFSNEFKTHVSRAWQELPPGFHVCFAGGRFLPNIKLGPPHFRSVSDHLAVHQGKWSVRHHDRTTHAYILSLAGAQKLIDGLERHKTGMSRSKQLDKYICSLFHDMGLTIHNVNPLPAHSPLGNDSDTGNQRLKRPI